MVYWHLPKMQDLKPEARGGCACTGVGSKVIIFGGADRRTQAYDDVWVLETENGVYQWEKKAVTCDDGISVHPRSGASLTAINNCLYLYGGQDLGSGFCHADILCLDTDTWRWSKVEVAGGKKPLPRHSHCMGKLADNCLLLFAGVGETGHMSDVWIFNVDQRGWTCPELGADKPVAREMHSGTMVNDTTMLVYGGRDSSGKVLDDMAVLDMKGSAWRSIEPTPFARCAHSAVAMPRADMLHGSATSSDNGTETHLVVVVYGGFSGEAVEGDVFYIDPATGEIEVVRRGPRPSDSKNSPSPEPRFAHSVAAVTRKETRSEMVVFGGVNPAEDLSDVAVLQCGLEPTPEPSQRAVPTGPAAVIEELNDEDGQLLDSSHTTIQHSDGLVELKIDEAHK